MSAEDLERYETEIELGDAWVWDMYRPARFVSSVRVVTFKDVNVEELPEKEDILHPVTSRHARPE